MHATSPTRLEQLGAEWATRAYEFCTTCPERSVYLAGWIHEGGLDQSPVVPRGWLLAERDGRGDIAGLAFLSATGILIPLLESESALGHLLALARSNPELVRVVVGERSIVREMWKGLASLGFKERLGRDQIVYSVTREQFLPTPGPELRLEVAKNEHLDELVNASAAMAREEAHDDPQARNPTLFRERIRARVQRGRDFVYLHRGHLAFKCNVSALSPLGGQLEGVYTNPDLRRRSLGKRGTSYVTRWVLDQSERTVLLVNDDNLPARKMYEALGYQAIYESRTVFIAP